MTYSQLWKESLLLRKHLSEVISLNRRLSPVPKNDSRFRSDGREFNWKNLDKLNPDHVAVFNTRLKVKILTTTISNSTFSKEK